MRISANLMIWYAALLHIIWGVCILLDGSAAGITGLYLLVKVFPGLFVAFVCFAVGILAVWGTLAPKSELQVFFLAPQQFVLFLSAASSVHCVARGAFADGVIHPSIFILADQVSSILVFLFYSVAIYASYQSSADEATEDHAGEQGAGR